MPLENIGKKITSIKFNKKNIVLHFAKKDKLEISEEAFSSMYLYEGKVLDIKDIRKLEEISNSSKLLKYALSLLTKGHYSEHSIREKLYLKEAKKPEVDYVIKSLKTADLINDTMFAEDLKEWGNERLEGKNKIIQTLYNKGIFEKEIQKLSFPRKLEIDKAKANLPKLEKRYEKYSYNSKKQHIYNALINLGFDNDVALEVVNKVKYGNPKEELEKLKKDLYKVKANYSRKYIGRELREHIIASLRNKGYKMNDILKCMEENDYDQNDFGIC